MTRLEQFTTAAPLAENAPADLGHAGERIPLEAYAADEPDTQAWGDAPGIEARDELPAFEFVPAGEMTANLKPISWLVRDYLELDSVAAFYGPPGCGKSLEAGDVACCVATGTTWHGNEVHQGAVFYLAGEGHSGLGRRLKAWELETGISLERAPLYVSRRGAALTEALAASQVAAAVDNLAKASGAQPALIVIDTLARNFGAADENSTSDMNQFIACIDNRLRLPWGCAVLVIHHSGKDGSRGARGSTALRGALDAEYEISRGDDKIVRMICRKMKDAEIPDPLAFSIEGVKLPLVDEDGNAVFGPVLRPAEFEPERENLRLNADEKIGLNHLSDDWKAFEIWRDDWFYEAGKLVAAKGKNSGKKRCNVTLRVAFGRQRFSLEKKGLIEVECCNDQKPRNVRLAQGSEVLQR